MAAFLFWILLLAQPVRAYLAPGRTGADKATDRPPPAADQRSKQVQGSIDITERGVLSWKANVPARVFVSMDDGPEKLLAEAAEGQARPDWIVAGHRYRFTLRSDWRTLDSVTYQVLITKWRQETPPGAREALPRILWRDLKLLGAAALALLAIFCSGRWLVARLGLPFNDRSEAAVFAWALGCLAISIAALGLAVAGLAYRGVFFALAFLALLGYRSAWPLAQKRSYTALEYACLAVGVVYTGIYVVAALAPEVSPDAVSYQLGLVRLYQIHHRLIPFPENFYSAFPEGMNMLYLFCSSLGGYSAARLAHLACLVALAGAIYSFGRRIGQPGAGALAAVATYTASVFGGVATTGYVDVALTLAVFLAFYAAFLWRQSGSNAYLWTAGLLSGLALSIKPTGIVAVFIVCAVGLWPGAVGLRPGQRLRAVLVACLLAAIVFSPWPVRNWVIFQNPLMPFGNRWFPNAHLLPSSEAEWLEVARHPEGFGTEAKDYLGWPWEVIIQGKRLHGFLGPFFLLAPLALSALWRREGRLLLAAAVLGALPISTNAFTRFLMPGVPFLALAICLGTYLLLPARAASGLLLLGLASQACLDLPWVVARRSYPTPLALREVPFAAAFRLQGERDYLARNISEFEAVQFIERQAPRHARVLSFGPSGQAYTRRLLIPYFASELARRSVETLYSAFLPGRLPEKQLQARFAPLKVRALRLVLPKGAPCAGWPCRGWATNELEVLGRDGQPLPRSTLQSSASTNPFEAPLANDGHQLSAWSARTPVAPGSWFQVNLGEECEVTGIRCRVPRASQLLPVLFSSADGKVWMPCRTEFSETLLEPRHWRRQATLLLKSWGIDYLLFSTNASDPFFSLLVDLLEKAAEWGVRDVFHSEGYVVLELLSSWSAP